MDAMRLNRSEVRANKARRVKSKRMRCACGAGGARGAGARGAGATLAAGWGTGWGTVGDGKKVRLEAALEGTALLKFWTDLLEAPPARLRDDMEGRRRGSREQDELGKRCKNRQKHTIERSSNTSHIRQPQGFPALASSF